jgi:hypothetical protein
MWVTVKHNSQGAKTTTVDSFADAPFTTSAIRLQSTYARDRNWFRIAEVIAYGTDGKQIPIVGARTNNHANWRKSTSAPELFDGQLAFRPGYAVHFTNRMDLWFGKDVTIAKLEIVQQGTARLQKSQWEWQRYNYGAYVDTGKIA